MSSLRFRASIASVLLLTACPKPDTTDDTVAPRTEPPTVDPVAVAEPEPEPPPALARTPLPDEKHFSGLRQLTFGGENAEAYLSGGEDQLIFQSKRDGLGCDQIFTMTVDGSDVKMISSGKGRTTCSYFLPGDQKILYASTHATADDCLPEPDRSKGYVWKLYDEYDIYTANADGSEVEVLTSAPGYDAEATVSPKGDTIVFTSMRDGDPELYRMNLDGSDVRRLTKSPGYDGGAFFSADGSQIVWRANRPKGKEEKAKYKELIDERLVRPTRLELFVMNADGSDQRQVTKNGAANFGPFWHPDAARIVFASNVADPAGRNFDLYIVGADGKSEPERITFHDEFDGFPMFTRDGKQLVFASNREHVVEGETNIFVADWVD